MLPSGIVAAWNTSSGGPPLEIRLMLDMTNCTGCQGAWSSATYLSISALPLTCPMLR